MRGYSMVAIDMGASSGRMILGSFDGKKISFVDEYRMETGFIDVHHRLYWNILGIYNGIIKGFRYFKNKGYHIDCVGVDTWGVDYVLLDQADNPVAMPRCYRDVRGAKVMDEVSGLMSGREFYEITGIVADSINSVYQLYADKALAAFNCAKSFLFISDYLCFMMTGEKAVERSLASTSQMLDYRTGRFSDRIQDRLGFDHLEFPEILCGAQVRGRFTEHFSELCGYDNLPVMNVNSHDTGSAISLAEALHADELLMNNGTYAILSSIRSQPLITDYSYACHITNESTNDGRFRPACNMNGMYFLNQVHERWKMEGKERSWSEMQAMAMQASSTGETFPLSAEELTHGGNVVRLIMEYCAAHGMRVPEDDGQLVRLVLESTAKSYAENLRNYELASGIQYQTLCIMGGGSKNDLLNQMIADYTGKKICTGTSEATALGNMLTQLQGAKQISGSEKCSLIRELITEPRFFPK